MYNFDDLSFAALELTPSKDYGPDYNGDDAQEELGDKFMPFHRARYDSKTGQSPNMPREQQNGMTSWIDGSFVYRYAGKNICCVV